MTAMRVEFPFSNPGAADTDPGPLSNGLTGLDYIPGKHRRRRARVKIGFQLPDTGPKPNRPRKRR